MMSKERNTFQYFILVQATKIKTNKEIAQASKLSRVLMMAFLAWSKRR